MAALPDQPQRGSFIFDVLARFKDERFAASQLTLFLLVLVNGLVLYNAISTPFDVGYDFASHVTYAEILSTGRLPDRVETEEFYSPPLAYVLPALAYAATGSIPVLAKVGQLQNVPFSIGITLLIVAFATRLSPDRPFHAPLSLLALAILPVYYRTFTFMRGEPMLAFFVLLGLYLLYRSTGALKDAIVVGVCIGLAALCRQLAFLALPGALIFAVAARRWRWEQLIAAALPFLLVGGWFYVSLTIRFGSPAAYFTAAGESGSSWRDFLGMGSGLLFTNPIRPSFDHQFLPAFYSDLWGDYWGYWAGHGGGMVDPKWISILARMNIVNLLPTGITLIALIGSLRQSRYALLYLVLAGTIAGYIAIVLTYNGDMIKATYMLQCYPLAALIVGGFLARFWRAALAVGIVLLLHNSILLTWHGISTSVDAASLALWSKVP